jgi:threonine dehydrogenase-like Zn-dependent dehydrogenase
MKAALKRAAGEFELVDGRRPGYEADWVLARIRVAGIYGTDLRHRKKEETEFEYHIMGHEMAGTVAEVGPEVINVKLSDRVVIETVLDDGTSRRCRNTTCARTYTPSGWKPC